MGGSSRKKKKVNSYLFFLGGGVEETRQDEPPTTGKPPLSLTRYYTRKKQCRVKCGCTADDFAFSLSMEKTNLFLTLIFFMLRKEAKNI